MEETGFTARAIACGRVLRTLHCANVGSRRPPRSSWSLPHCSSCQRAAGRIARVRHGTQPRRVIGICSGKLLPNREQAGGCSAAHLSNILEYEIRSGTGKRPVEERYLLSQAAKACANARVPDSPFSRARMA
jgi:hypothetical protein